MTRILCESLFSGRSAIVALLLCGALWPAFVLQAQAPSPPPPQQQSPPPPPQQVPQAAPAQAAPPPAQAAPAAPLAGTTSGASAPTIGEIRARGNAKVEESAIVTLLKSQKGAKLDRHLIREDIRTLFDLGYFSDVRIFQVPHANTVDLVVQVVEKPAITKIEFVGMNEVSQDDLKDKLMTKIYTIVNEATIATDVRMIERQYIDKGFYLAKVSYSLEQKGANETELFFNVEEGAKVQVAEVFVLGNEYFTEADIINKLASRPFTRMSAFSSSSIFQDDFVKRDLEFIAFYYKDWGFAEVQVAKPVQTIDPDREFVRLTFKVEEGLQYNVGSIDFSGDVLFPKEEMAEQMLLKPGALFRYSQFTKDIEYLVDKYGDLGYAYVDPNPKHVFDKEKRIVHLNYEITKGPKVYFGDMTIVGNEKTRDNVIRRELQVADAELYSGTRMTESKKNINRLAFFEQVQIIKERDQDDEKVQNLKIKVKEKATGQLQAALGFSPSQGTSQSSWFLQGRYDEKNQSGRGWRTNLTLKSNREKDHSVQVSFTNPRVNDSLWSAGTSASYENTVREHVEGVDLQEKRVSASISLGRDVIEKVHASLTYRVEKIEQTSTVFILDRFRESGIKSSAIVALSRSDTDNQFEPTDGTEIVARQEFNGGPLLGGDYQFMESSLDVNYYLPWDYTETFRTNFRAHGNVAYVYPMGDETVPFVERLRLGGYNDLRGFDHLELGPKFDILRAPGAPVSHFNKGGDKRLYFQFEYYVPLIPEAGIKAIAFADMGRVYDQDEVIELSGFSKDVGFGFRWVTPVAPFRFEWAYPIEDGALGEGRPIFFLGF